MITYDYYRIFYFVAQYHSFTKAAEILKNNQPNITRCMNNLESELGCKLFIRSHQGVTLTAEGEKVYERVAVAYEQLRTVEEELALERSLESGLITIGASETALRLMLLSRLEHFHTRYPHVRLRISNHSTPQASSARKRSGRLRSRHKPGGNPQTAAQDPDFPIPGNSDRRIEICIPFRRAASSRRIVRISFYLACQRHRHAGAVRRVLSESQPRLPPRYGGGDDGSDSSYGRV